MKRIDVTRKFRRGAKSNLTSWLSPNTSPDFDKLLSEVLDKIENIYEV